MEEPGSSTSKCVQHTTVFHQGPVKSLHQSCKTLSSDSETEPNSPILEVISKKSKYQMQQTVKDLAKKPKNSTESMNIVSVVTELPAMSL